MIPVKNAITTSLQNLELIVQPFDKAAAGSIDKVIGNFFPPMLQSLQKLVETNQPAHPNPFNPGLDFALSDGWRERLVKDSGQLLAQVIGLLQFRGIFPQLSQYRKSKKRLITKMSKYPVG